MTPADLLIDAFTRVLDDGVAVVSGLDRDQLSHRVGADANSIAWLVWHLTRVQDDHVSEVAGREQLWTAEGFIERFGFDFEPDDIGYGHDDAQVARVRADARLLTAYLRAVHEQTVRFLRTVSPEDLDRVVDERWDPPVTLGVRLVSVVNDDTQHVGQAAFVRGLLGL
ncbi:mycothiol transferase [Nocardioides ferulae]|uniref:mycothiol transferase n=1 Tax=Nocardioides ferulae TaxID=2340821 RepID=UPI000EADEC0B|nr:DUF664 domain-containing protein [Nocardioides ferulae]